MIKCVFFLGYTTSWVIDNVQLIKYDRFFVIGSDAVQGGCRSACRITCSSPLAIHGGGLANDWRRLWVKSKLVREKKGVGADSGKYGTGLHLIQWLHMTPHFSPVTPPVCAICIAQLHTDHNQSGNHDMKPCNDDTDLMWFMWFAGETFLSDWLNCSRCNWELLTTWPAIPLPGHLASYLPWSHVAFVVVCKKQCTITPENKR